MNVAEIMSRDLSYVSPDTSLDDAVALMDGLDVRHLPVVEATSVVGVVSDRDLLAAIGWGPPSSAGKVFHAGRVRDVMHTDVTIASPEDTVVTVAVDFVLQGIGCLPVVENGTLTGIVTDMDMLAAYSLAARSETLDGNIDPPVAEHMTGKPLTVKSGTTIAEAIAICRRIHVRHLPVVDGGTLVGILSDRDLRGAIGAGRPDSMTVDTIMACGCLTVKPVDRLCRAAELMYTFKISALPVLDGGTVAGIVTLTDVLDHCMNTLREPEPGAS